MIGSDRIELPRLPRLPLPNAPLTKTLRTKEALCRGEQIETSVAVFVVAVFVVATRVLSAATRRTAVSSSAPPSACITMSASPMKKLSAEKLWRIQTVGVLGTLPTTGWGQPAAQNSQPARYGRRVPTGPPVFEIGLRVRVETSAQLKIEPAMAEAIYIAALSGRDDDVSRATRVVKQRFEAAKEAAVARLMDERAQAYFAAEAAAAEAQEATAGGAGGKGGGGGGAKPPPKQSAAEAAAAAAEEEAREAAALAAIQAQAHMAVSWALFDVHAGKTPVLSLAAGRGYTSTVSLLLAAGHRVDSVADDGSQALHRAASRGHTDAVRVLLRADADAEARSEEGGTPMHDAAREGHVEVVRCLLDGPGEGDDGEDENGGGDGGGGGGGGGGDGGGGGGDEGAGEAVLRVARRMGSRDVANCTPLMMACMVSDIPVHNPIHHPCPHPRFNQSPPSLTQSPPSLQSLPLLSPLTPAPTSLSPALTSCHCSHLLPPPKHAGWASVSRR